MYLVVANFLTVSLFNLLTFVEMSTPVVTLPGCCITPDECNQWMDSLKLHSSRKDAWFEIRPQQHNSICSSPSAQILLDMNHFASSYFQSSTLSISGSTEHEEQLQILLSTNASIEVSTNTQRLGNFPQDSYCIRKKDSQFMEVEICLSKSPWYRKCCPVGQGFNFSYGCVDLDRNPRSKFPPVMQHKEENKSFYPVVTYQLLSVSCSSPTIISSALSKLDYIRTPWKMVGSNRITYYNRKSYAPHWKILEENYCVDQLVLHEDSIDKDVCGDDEQDVLIFCEDEAHSENIHSSQQASRYIFTWINIFSLGIAMCFLCATSLGFILLEKQNVHKKSMLFYVMSQLLFYFFVLIIYVDDQVLKILNASWCVPVGVLAHFFGVSTFAWLLIINFDLWWTFRVLNPSTDIHWTRLAWYAIVAIAIPVTIIVVALLLQHFSNETPIQCRRDAEKTPIRVPGYGVEHCFLSDNAQLHYFYTPVGVLLLANVIFYSCTSYRLCTLNKKNKGHSAKKHRSSCQLLLKLFIVMGTVWIFQVIHALIDLHERTWYWSIVDAGSVLLQSIAIFVIFICKRENWRTLTKKYPALRGMLCTRGLEILPDTTTPDGSTRLSRTDCQRKSGVPEFQQPSEIIQLPYHNSS